MVDSKKTIEYVPGFYTEKKPSAADLAYLYIREWDEEQKKIEKEDIHPIKLLPTICFSRIIGVGAVEIADILARKIGYRVVDRQILEHITNEIKLRNITAASFDKRYPGKMSEYLSDLFNESSFPDNDYNRHLFATIRSIAGLGPTIFIGWGTHLVLPRERVMAVRFVCSKAYRIKRLATILNVEEQEIERKLEDFNLKQSYFFKKVYHLEKASTQEFDLVINCDYINDPQWAAEIVEENFRKKFLIGTGR
ncbi:MAG: cytidylate kinase-like family protein [Deltaproteobacteria bacterium]|jgi:cytidylate kinase|nr:cytidylate kinase-like family protein [Deltaproteobacteria bacterium]